MYCEQRKNMTKDEMCQKIKRDNKWSVTKNYNIGNMTTNQTGQIINV